VWSSDGSTALYDVAADPGAGHDLAGDPGRAAEAAGLREALDAYVAAHGGPTPLPSLGVESGVGVFESLDAESAELLRELGYLPE